MYSNLKQHLACRWLLCSATCPNIAPSAQSCAPLECGRLPPLPQKSSAARFANSPRLTKHSFAGGGGGVARLQRRRLQRRRPSDSDDLGCSLILPHYPKPASSQSTAAAAVEASLGCGDGEAEVASPSNGRAAADANPNVLCAGSMSGAVLWRFLRGWFFMRPTPRSKELKFVRTGCTT